MRTHLLALLIFIVATALPSTGVVAGQAPGGPAPGTSGVTVLHFGKLWDGSKVVNDPVVVVEGDRVKSVGSGPSAIPPNARVVDLTRLYAIPGLIDDHTHITYWAEAHPRPGVRPLQTSMGLPTAVRVFMAQENARKSLEAGFTTVRDLGAQEYADLAMRDLINRGAMVGPRIFGAGYGLHTTSRAPRAGEVLVPSGGEANGRAEVLKAVREQVAAGADVIKMFGSVGGFDNVNTTQTFTFEEMQAAVEVAHAYGKKIAIHSYGPTGARDAVRAGTDSLEHAVDIDDETLQEMVKRGTVYIPTVAHNQNYWDNADWYGFAPGYAEKFKDYIDRNKATLRRAIKAGVRIGMGSDAVFVMWGHNGLDLPIYVQCGMTPEQALVAATRVNATLLPAEKSLGAVAPGYFADIVGVQGDPLADVNVVLSNVRWVMKGGQVVVNKTDGGRTSPLGVDRRH
ncbi:MAG TPA: amidohydrolase family protein [Vicinamibacterales bacterium]|jgi:imidazolonepropionase-like amidohydrolase|nr:amidohydrolase family protein [Vicinamibacterales bacterium]